MRFHILQYAFAEYFHNYLWPIKAPSHSIPCSLNTEFQAWLCAFTTSFYILRHIFAMCFHDYICALKAPFHSILSNLSMRFHALLCTLTMRFHISRHAFAVHFLNHVLAIKAPFIWILRALNMQFYNLLYVFIAQFHAISFIVVDNRCTGSGWHVIRSHDKASNLILNRNRRRCRLRRSRHHRPTVLHCNPPHLLRGPHLILPRPPQLHCGCSCWKTSLGS